MKGKPTCVFDTNCLISALLIKNSVSRKAFDKAFDYYEILISDQTIAEFEDVARREKFKKYLKEGEREFFEELLYNKSKLVKVTVIVNVCRDSDDDKFLECALDGEANIIISGDKDLLVLDPFREIRIVTPRSFLEHFD